MIGHAQNDLYFIKFVKKRSKIIVIKRNFKNVNAYSGRNDHWDGAVLYGHFYPIWIFTSNMEIVFGHLYQRNGGPGGCKACK
eukprot:9222826-Ditylum_brightwellii.AAC.1